MLRDINNSEIRVRLADFFKMKSGVLLVFLFGSAASGKMTDDSDIDIGILFEYKHDFYEINELKSELNTILKKEIDIAVLNSASPILKMQVLKNGILAFAQDKKSYNEFFVDTINQYDDLKQIRKICEDSILKGRIYAG
jgi:uncharacterized protein